MPQLRSIQYLRALAALMVVACHVIQLQAAAPGSALYQASLAGAAGVDMFFVISGFVMALVCRREPNASAFLRDRLIRIAPLYWLCTLLRLAGALAASRVRLGPPVEIGHVLTSFAFLPYRDAFGRISPLVTQGWTLQYEMFFYLIVAAGLRFAPRRVMAVATAILVGLTALGALMLAPSATSAGILSIYVDPMLLEFVAGMAIGSLWNARRLPSPGVGAALIALGGGGLIAAAMAGSAFEPLRLLAWGGPCALIVLGCVALEAGGRMPNIRFLGATGDASYSLYLTHSSVMFGLAGLRPDLPLGSPGVLAFALALIGACVGAAHIVHRWVDAPIQAALRGLTKRRAAPLRTPIEGRPIEA